MAGTYRRPVSPKQQAEREAARQEKLEQLHDQLSTGIRALADGPQWQAWLRSAARFHRYSFRNTLLISMQRPTATTVAGYEAWKTHGRQVTKGERGIQILAPVLVGTKEAERTSEAPAAGPPAAPAAGQEKKRQHRKLVNVRVAYVWDVAQTSGDPLPTQPAPQMLHGQAPEGMWDGLAGQVTKQGFTLERGDCGPAEGWTNFATRTVRVRSDVDDADAVTTLAHELGHVLLHAPDAHGQGTSLDLCRGVKEVEAESYAFLVAAAHGLATDQFTFPYVAGWAASVPGTELEQVLTATATRVLGAASGTLAATLDENEVVPDELAAAVTAGQERATALAERAEASRTGCRLPAPQADLTELLAMQAEASKWYAAQLTQHSAAGEYLVDRGIPPAMSTALGIGYAPAGWTGLCDHLSTLGHSPERILEAGLGIRTRRGTVVDRFRDRLMFPHRDEHGTVVGFIGRTQSTDPATPKYLNSPASAIYRKGHVLYGLAENRRALETGATPVLCEGSFDALAVTLSGAGRYVGLATSGTALTVEQVAALDRIAPLSGRRVMVAFDSDEAGENAACAAWDHLRKQQAVCERARLESGMDPAKLYELGGSSAVAAVLSRSRPLVELVITRRLENSLAAVGSAASSIEKRIGALREVAPLVAELPTAATARQVSWLADRLGLGFATVNATVLDALAPVGDACARAEAAQRPPQVAVTQRKAHMDSDRPTAGAAATKVRQPNPFATPAALVQSTGSQLVNAGRPKDLGWAPLAAVDEAPTPTTASEMGQQCRRNA